MTKFPSLIATSVIRSAHQGQSHGGVYLVDLESATWEQVVDWNDPSINWDGRGGDRGLRGIAFHDGYVLLAASDELFVYTRDFELVESFRNPFLKQCHEICVGDGKLWLTSTKFDSILAFDLSSGRFVTGYNLTYGKFHVGMKRLGFRVLPKIRIFDPEGHKGPERSDTLHLNSVHFTDGTIFVSGTALGQVLMIHGDVVERYARTPYKTHNAQPYGDGILLNHTAIEAVAFYSLKGQLLQRMPVKRYDDGSLTMTHLPQDHARQAFARGLCTAQDGLIVGGASPATISVYRFGEAEPMRVLNITMDVRNAIHGLELWPY